MSIAVRLVVTLFVISLWSPAFAMDSGGCGGECASCHSLSNKEAAGLLKDLGTVKWVKPSQVRGLFEVEVERDGHSGIVYIDYGKKKLIAGQIFDIASLKPVVGPAAEPRKRAERLDPSMLSTADSLLMGNPKGKKRLFVFTDPECPFCRKLHAELKKLVELEPDLAIYIKLFPLKMHPHAYDEARVILGEGSLALLERSYAGEKLPPVGSRDGKKGVDETMKFAETYGINSTPTVVFPDGRIMPGVRPARELQQLLGGK